MFTHLQKAELKVNTSKSCCGAHKFDYLGYHFTRSRVMPIPKKVKAIQSLAVPKTRKQLRQFIGMINFNCDIWQNRSELLTPLTSFTSKNVKYNCKDEHQKCFDAIKHVNNVNYCWPTRTSMLRLKYIMMLPNYKLAQSYPERASPFLSVHERNGLALSGYDCALV